MRVSVWVHVCVRLRALVRARVYMYTGMCLRLRALVLARARVCVCVFVCF